MAKKEKTLGKIKVTFGSRKIGRAKKRLGPKEGNQKKYRGQGK